MLKFSMRIKHAPTIPNFTKHLNTKKQGKLVSHAKTKLFDKPIDKIKSKQKLHSIFIMSKTH